MTDNDVGAAGAAGESGGGAAGPFPPAPAERTFTQAEVNEMLDRDRIHGFLLFARSLRDDAEGPVWGTAHQVKAIQRALEKAGYT